MEVCVGRLVKATRDRSGVSTWDSDSHDPGSYPGRTSMYPVRRGKCLRRGSIQGPLELESNVIATKLLEGLPAKGFTSLPHGLSE